jgi:DNA-directed RNA polymerase specialized sigma24 family protein
MELNLLIQVKVDGEPGDSFSEQLGLSPNAFRQRLKRLLAKLRRLAQTRPPDGKGAG